MDDARNTGFKDARGWGKYRGLLVTLYISILILTISDMICTSSGIISGFIVENNPILAPIFAISPLFASVYVILFTLLVLYALHYWERTYRWVHYGILLILMEKIVVMLLHLHWIVMVIAYGY